MHKNSPGEQLNRLFDAARAGSREALERLLTTLRPRIYFEARRYTSSRPQAIGPSSLTQEVSLALSRLITRVRGSHNATLFRLVHRLIQSKGASAFRRETALKRDGGWRESWDDSNLPALDLSPSPHDLLEQTQKEHRLLILLANLPERQRSAVEGILLGQSISEIAASLDCSAAAVYNLLQRAKSQFEPSESIPVPEVLIKAVAAYLQERRWGRRPDVSVLATQYPGQEAPVLSFLSWLERLKKAWSRTIE